MNGRLTNNGLIIMANGEEYLLTDLVKYYKKNNSNEKNVYYDEKEGILNIIIDSGEEYRIIFNEKQKESFETNANNPSIKKLQKLHLDSESETLLKQVYKDITKGVYPTNGKAISVLAKSLNEDMLETGAEVVKNGLKAIWPYLLLGISIPLLIYSDPLSTDSWHNILSVITITAGFISTAGGIIGSIVRFGSLLANDGPSEAYGETLESLKELKKKKKKKKDLKDHLKEVKIEKEPEKNQIIIDELQNTLNLIEDMSEEDKKIYSKKVMDISSEYVPKMVNIINVKNIENEKEINNKIDNLYKEYSERINDLKKEIKEINQKEKQINEFTGKMEEVQQQAESMYNQWSDDLSAGNTQALEAPDYKI